MPSELGAPAGSHATVPWRRAALTLVPTAVVLLAVGVLFGLLAVGRTGTGSAGGVDRPIWRWFVAHRYLVEIAKLIGTYLDAAPLGVLAVVLGLLIWWRSRSVLAVLPVLAYLGGEGLVFGLRLVIHRHRPPTANFPAPHAVPGVHETGWSFPSGHATAVTAVLFACLGAYALLRAARWPWLLALLASGYVAASRLDLGVHWFSDVATGLVLGAVWGVTCAVALTRLSAGSAGPDRPSAAPRHGAENR